MNPGQSVLWALFAMVGGAGAMASDTAVQPGRYEIVARTLMPHLAENLRYASVHEVRCVSGTDPAALFPILRHESLRGCRLGIGQHAGAEVTYALVCDNANVATGSARIIAGPGQLSAMLRVKMGGKNMTFAQVTEARRVGDCPDANRGPQGRRPDFRPGMRVPIQWAAKSLTPSHATDVPDCRSKHEHQ